MPSDEAYAAAQRICKVCSDQFNILDSFSHKFCPICDTVLSAVESIGVNAARGRLHLINGYIAKGVDD